MIFFSFFFHDTTTTEIYTLSLHDALPILIDTSISASSTHYANGFTPLLRGPLIRFNSLLIKHSFRVFLGARSEEHTSELQSRPHLVCRLLLEKKNNTTLSVDNYLVMFLIL